MTHETVHREKIFFPRMISISRRQPIKRILISRSLVCAIINAVCAALMDAGIMTTDMITSCSAGIANPTNNHKVFQAIDLYDATLLEFIFDNDLAVLSLLCLYFILHLTIFSYTGVLKQNVCQDLNEVQSESALLYQFHSTSDILWTIRQYVMQLLVQHIMTAHRMF